MKSKDDSKQKAIEKDYNEIMEGFGNENNLIVQTPQWTKPSDLITKFSLYQDSPSSITSTETSIFFE